MASRSNACLGGYAHQAQGAETQDFMELRKEEQLGDLSMEPLLLPRYFSMVPEVPEWRAGFSFPRQFNIIQVTLHGMQPLLISEDVVLKAPVNLRADGSLGEHFCTPITITLHVHQAGCPSAVIPS